MRCSANFSIHDTLHSLADVPDNSCVYTGKRKPSRLYFLDWYVEKLNKFHVNQIFRRFGKERGHGHGKRSLVTLEHKVTCSLLIYGVKICLGHHGVVLGLVWGSGKTGFLEFFVQYEVGRDSLLLDWSLVQLSKAMPQNPKLSCRHQDQCLLSKTKSCRQ